MIKITVIHMNEGKRVPVAEVVTNMTNIDDALDYAYRWTNNIEGSWSWGETLDYCDNADYNPNVTCIHPLPVYNGKKYGHRSTSVGDTMIVEGQGEFVVASFGFKKID